MQLVSGVGIIVINNEKSYLAQCLDGLDISLCALDEIYENDSELTGYMERLSALYDEISLRYES